MLDVRQALEKRMTESTTSQSQESHELCERSSIWHRFCAVFVDGVVVGLPVFAAYVLVAGWPLPVPETFLKSFLIGLGLCLMYFVYEAVMLQHRGQTVGKIAMRIEVVQSDGTPLGVSRSWLRSFLKILVFRGWLLSLFNVLPALFTVQKTAIHDMLLKTRVRYQSGSHSGKMAA